MFPFLLNKKDKELYFFIKSITGYKPQDLNLYKKAFKHKSVDSTNNLNNNERLEFLGDSILNMIVADYLYENFQDFDEGKLTQARSKIVNFSNLTIICQKLKLTDFLQTKTTKLNEKHFYADTLEAFIGAFFKDKGYKKTYKFVIDKIINQVDINNLITSETNHKSKLFEISQKNKFKLRFITEKTLFDNNLFISKIFVNEKLVAQGLGITKKQAEQNASHFAIENLNIFFKNNGQENLN